MSELSDAELIAQIALAVKKELLAENPGFVRRDLCNERVAGLKKGLDRLYWMWGAVSLAMLGAILTAALA